jgi:hypothetical protein
MSIMDSNVQPSFIPKKVLSQQAQKPKHHMSLFSLIGTIIFITVIILAGLVVGAEYVINNNIEQKQAALQLELDKFQGKLVSDLFVLDTRLIVSNALLKKHFSLSEFLSFLGKNTLKSIGFSSFNFNSDGSDKGPIVALNGHTSSFASLALQQRQFNNPANVAFIKDVQITNPNLDQNGQVTFTVTANLDPDKFSYATLIKDKGVTGSSTQATASSTATTTGKTASTTKATSTKPKTR